MDEKERLEEEKRQDELEERNGVAWLKSNGATSLYYIIGIFPIVLFLAFDFSRILAKEEFYALSFLFFFAFHLGRMISFRSVWKAGYTKQSNKPDGANGLTGPSE